MVKIALRSLFDLFYPKLCLACGQDTIADQEIICLPCTYHLPKTSQHLYPENQFTDRFWGRLDLQAASAYLYFSKQGRAQQLLHQLKYKRQWQVGEKLGEAYGKILKAAPLFQDIELILPVPLHPRRLKQRDFNQSDHFASGLSSSMGIPWSNGLLERKIETVSQTQKTRMERFSNVEHAFRLPKPRELQGKNVLLVDDVLTTGATLEAVGLKLLAAGVNELSFATIAIAEQ